MLSSPVWLISWISPGYDVFGANLRKVPQDLRRYIPNVTGAVEIVKKSNRTIQRISKSARRHNFLASIRPGAGAIHI
jgi:hypothetical protein